MLNWRELDADEVELCVRRGMAGEKGFLPTGFLDTHQWIALEDIQGLIVDGGFQAAQYRIAHLDGTDCTLHYASIDQESLPRNARTVTGLRSLLRGTSIPDAAIGDIYLDDRFVLALVDGIFLDEFGIEAEYSGSAPAISLPEERLTSASLRADAVVSAAFRVSRAEAQKALKYGFVYCDFQPVAKRTQDFRAGNRIVYRSRGSLDIVDTGINPRSGRSWLLVRRLTS